MTTDRNIPGLRLTVILLLVHVGLAAPAVFSGWMNDDYFFDTPLYETDAPFGYYDFMDRFEEAHLQPWWISPDFQLRFLRPLSSLTLHLDHTLFGANPLGAHLHSLLWSLALLLGGFSLLRSALPRREAGWAMIIFTLAICHAWGAGWIAARHAVMAGALAAWSAAFYLRWRAGEGVRYSAFSLALFVVGLAAGETALSAAGLFLCYELVGARGSRGERLKALAPFAALSLVYVVTYKLSGYGARGSGAYLDPFSQPGEFLADLLPKLLAVIGSFGMGTPAMMRAIPGAGGVPIAAGVLTIALLATGRLLIRKRLDDDRRILLRWLLPALVIPSLPALSGLAQGREFVLAAIAFAGAAAVVLRGLFSVRGAWYRRIVPFGIAGLLFLGLFVLNPLSRLGQSAFIYIGSKMTAESGERSKVDCPANAPVYVVNGDFMRAVGFPFAIARQQARTFPGWQHLITPESDIRIERTAADRLVVTSDDKPLINDFLQIYRRGDDRLALGEVVEIEGMRAEVLAVSPAGPTRIEFTIPTLASPNGACLLRYEDGALRTWSPPPVGEIAVISHVPPLP